MLAVLIRPLGLLRLKHSASLDVAVLDCRCSSELPEVVSALPCSPGAPRSDRIPASLQSSCFPDRCRARPSQTRHAAAACSELAEEPVVRAQTADSATARQPAGRAPVGATLDGGNWVCVLSDGKNDDDDDDEDDDAALQRVVHLPGLNGILGHCAALASLLHAVVTKGATHRAGWRRWLLLRRRVRLGQRGRRLRDGSQHEHGRAQHARWWC